MERPCEGNVLGVIEQKQGAMWLKQTDPKERVVVDQIREVVKPVKYCRPVYLILNEMGSHSQILSIELT